MTDEQLRQLHTERLDLLASMVQTLRAENVALRDALDFVWSRIEDNAKAWEADNGERGWRATFEYEELDRINPAALAQKRRVPSTPEPTEETR